MKNDNANILISKCPFCFHEIEFLPDEMFVMCPICNKAVRAPDKALECGSRDVINICRQLVNSMAHEFGDDICRINHALHVLYFAEQISVDMDIDHLVVGAAAILHDIGIQEAERIHGSSAGNFQELEGPPIARRIMQSVEMIPETIEHVCDIVGSHHSARDIDTPEFRVIWDADWLVNIPEEFPDWNQEKLSRLVDKVFKTGPGIKLAKELFLG